MLGSFSSVYGVFLAPAPPILLLQFLLEFFSFSHFLEQSEQFLWVSGGSLSLRGPESSQPPRGTHLLSSSPALAAFGGVTLEA